MKGMNEAHRAAKLERMERRQIEGRERVDQARYKKHTVKNNLRPTNTPAVIYRNWKCPLPTAWRIAREKYRTFNRSTGCFEYSYGGTIMKRRTIRAAFDMGTVLV